MTSVASPLSSPEGPHVPGAPGRVRGASEGGCEVFYWRNRNREVDFVVRAGRTVTAIEVESGRTRRTLPGIAALTAAFKPNRVLLVGGDGIPLAEFLSRRVEHWVA